MAQAQVKGMTLPVVDGLLAATALQHNLTAVTRNVSDFAVASIKRSSSRLGGGQTVKATKETTMRIEGGQCIVCSLFFASYILGPNVISGQIKESEEDRLVRQIMETEIFNDWFRGQSAGSNLTEVATAILAASGDEPTDLKLARGLNELYLGYSSSVDAKYIELFVQNELDNHQARSKLGQDCLERSITLGVNKASYSHKIGLLQSAESNSQMPDPTWTAEMVRLVRLLRSASSPDVLKMRQERMTQIRALLPKHPEWKALNEVRSMVQAVGRAKERIKAFQQASSKAPQ